MILTAIAAMAQNRCIGVNNKLPWHIPEDLKFFKDKTLGKKIIMGRKTFESLGRPLPKRENIVISRRSDFHPEGVKVFNSLESALADVESRAEALEEVFIVGGAEIYSLSLSKIHRLYLTLVDQEVPGDAFFPEVDLKKDFKIIEERKVQGNPSYTFVTAERMS